MAKNEFTSFDGSEVDIMGECRCQNQTLLETNQFHAKFFSRGILAG